MAEVVALLLSVPGHVMFVVSLWSGQPLQLSLRFMMLYVAPHCFLPQLASSMASSILGSVGIFSFCLTLITTYATSKPVSG